MAHERVRGVEAAQNFHQGGVELRVQVQVVLRVPGPHVLRKGLRCRGVYEVQLLVPVLRGRFTPRLQVIAQALPGVQAVEQLTRITFELIRLGHRRFLLVIPCEHDVSVRVDELRALAWVGAVVEGVPQRDQQLGLLRIDVAQHRFQSFEVRVHVRDEGNAAHRPYNVTSLKGVPSPAPVSRRELAQA